MRKTENRLRILLIDDNIIDRQDITEIFRNTNSRFLIIATESQEDFELHLKARDFDVAISETSSHGYPDLQVLQMLKQQAPEMPVLIYSRNTSV
jgi:DNA-binding NtrC family response regulator